MRNLMNLQLLPAALVAAAVSVAMTATGSVLRAQVTNGTRSASQSTPIITAPLAPLFPATPVPQEGITEQQKAPLPPPPAPPPPSAPQPDGMMQPGQGGMMQPGQGGMMQPGQGQPQPWMQPQTTQNGQGQPTYWMNSPSGSTVEPMPTMQNKPMQQFQNGGMQGGGNGGQVIMGSMQNGGAMQKAKKPEQVKKQYDKEVAKTQKEITRTQKQIDKLTKNIEKLQAKLDKTKDEEKQQLLQDMLDIYDERQMNLEEHLDAMNGHLEDLQSWYEDYLEAQAESTAEQE